MEVDRAALERASGDGSVVIVPLASAPEGDETFDGWAEMGLGHYEAMGADARVSLVKTREDAHDSAFVSVLDGASMIYFSGGNPAYVAETLRDSLFWKRALELFEAGTVLAGCSAGACMLGELAPDSAADEAFFRGEQPKDWAVPGLGVMPNVVFGPHWNMLGVWIPGLDDFIRAETPDECLLLALDDETAILGDGSEFTVYGNGTVQLAPGGTTAATYTAGDTFTIP